MRHSGTKTLETERLILRRFTVEDAEDMYQNLCSDSRVNKFLTWDVHKSIDETVEVGIQKLKEKGYLESGDKIILSGGHSFVNGVKSSKMIGGYVEI